jgi:hypothetical protein
MFLFFILRRFTFLSQNWRHLMDDPENLIKKWWRAWLLQLFFLALAFATLVINPR